MNTIDSFNLNWLGLAEQLCFTDNHFDTAGCHSTSSASSDDIKIQFEEQLAAVHSHSQKPDRKAIESERLRALASLPPEEQKSFLAAMEFLITNQERRCRPLEKRLTERVKVAEMRANDPHSRIRAQHARLIKQKVDKALNSLPSSTLSCSDLQKEISFILQTAHHFSIKPFEVTDQHKANYQKHQVKAAQAKAEAEAQAAFDELLEEESKSKANREARSNRNGKKRGNHSNRNRTRQPNNTAKLEKAKSHSSAQMNNTGKAISNCQKAPKETSSLFEPNDAVLSEHHRVTKRWRSNSYDDLKRLTDFVDGVPVHRYEHMDEQELMFQRACHYLPGIETILAAPKARARYTFETPKGFGILAKLVMNDTSYEGIVYLGVERTLGTPKDHLKIYHKCFKQLSGVDSLFRSNGSSSHQIDELEDGWEPVGKYSLTVEKDARLNLLFENEGHRLTVYPVSESLREE